MPVITWHEPGSRRYETGVDRGVLYLRTAEGTYTPGVAWNGLTAVNQSPSGAEPSPQYADNVKYLNLLSAEEFAATIEAFTYPDEFAQCDGTAEIVPGMSFHQQTRKTFGFSYRTLVGNDLEGTDHGYKLHLIWGALAAPSERANATMNDSPEAMTLSWSVSTTPEAAPTVDHKPTAIATFDSTKFTEEQMKRLEDVLYGKDSEAPRLPLPAELVEMFSETGVPEEGA